MDHVTVIVPTYNRLGRLRQVLAGLEAQSFPRDRFDVVVVSDGSTDGTEAFLRDLASPLQVTPVLQANQGPAAARNAGVAEARGELLLFIDDDVVPDPQLIAEHVASHEAAADRVVLGPMLTPADFRLAPWVQWEQEMLVKQYRAMEAGEWEPTARQFYTGNTSLARRHVVAAGGFDARFRRAEDVELAFRLARRGVRFLFNPRAVGHHYAERSFRSWIEIPYAYGRNDVIFAREGQDWLLDAIRREFRERNRLVASLVRLCLGRGALSRAALAALKGAAELNARLGAAKLARFAHSAMFNLRYYQGVADELGGRRQFFRLAAGAR
jgi:GT2 family glycosyltransferase